MFDLYTAPTPNGLKPMIALELLGLDYNIRVVNLAAAEQKTPEFLAFNPNGRIPVLVDKDASGGPFALSESAAILVYLAEKTGRLLPEQSSVRARVYEQLFLHASGLAPAFGNAGWFQRSAPEQLPVAIDRFRTEALRIMGVIDTVLASQPFVAGGELTIADIAHFGWLWRTDYIGVSLDEFVNLKRWYRDLSLDPAFTRAITKLQSLGQR